MGHLILNLSALIWINLRL